MRRSIATAGTAAALLLCWLGMAHAQGPASAPAIGPRSGMAAGGAMQGWRMGPDNTPGWSLMSREERREHHNKMLAMTDHAACTAYMEQHRVQMAERARQQGRPGPAKPRQDACAQLKK